MRVEEPGPDQDVVPRVLSSLAPLSGVDGVVSAGEVEEVFARHRVEAASGVENKVRCGGQIRRWKVGVPRCPSGEGGRATESPYFFRS